MIPSDHFVRFYNEVFKFLDRKGDLADYYHEISRHQEFHCLQWFREQGLQGMYDYWEHIRIEENCDMELTLAGDVLHLQMRTCPSLHKVIDNDAGPCEKYCDHCPGWVLPLIAKAGHWCIYDINDRKITSCDMWIFRNQEDARRHWDALLAAGRPPEVLSNNFELVNAEAGIANPA